MKRIGVTANLSKPAAPAVLRRVANQAVELGWTLVVCDETAQQLPQAKCVTSDLFPRRIDALIALGGDGTLLHAVRMLKGADVPLLGVNLGSLGFLTSVLETDVERAMKAMVAGECRESRRVLAEARIRRGRRILGPHGALNDVVIGWGESSRVVHLRLDIDDEEVGHYVCDGLIVSTPTGSTGHSLSGGGPIIHPEAPVFVINPICPHTLSHRPMVVPDASRIEIHVLRSSKRQLFAIDGQDHHHILEGDRIEIRRGARPVRLLHPPGYSYFDLLRRKLHLRGSAV